MENYYLIVSALFYLSIMTASFIFLSRQHDHSVGRYRVVVTLFLFTMFGIISDTLHRLDSGGLINLPASIFVLTVINNYVFVPVLAALWFLYIVYTSYSSKVPRTYIYIAIGLLVINLILSLISFIPGTNLYFVIADDFYSRGKWFLLNTALFVVFYFLAMFVYVRYFKTFGRSEQYIFLIIFIAPLIGLVGHLTNEHIPFLLMNNVFCYMILAMNIQYINASTDFLTGLANRRSLSNHLHNRMTGSDKQSSFSIIMFDLDNFKMINDTMGHNVGDDALRQFGRFLRNNCKDVDFVARFGGDEFILVLDSMSPEQLTQKVAIIRESFKLYEGNKVGDFQIGFSAGYFIHTKDLNLSVSELISIIDERMFKDKRKRGNGLI